MTTFRCDNLNPEHIKSAVTSSQTVQGNDIELFGAMAASVQAVLTGGAAGTLYIDGTNQITDPNRSTTATWQNITSQAMTANQSAVFNFSLTDAITSMSRLRCRFISTAAGNAQVSVNVRRMTY